MSTRSGLRADGPLVVADEHDGPLVVGQSVQDLLAARRIQVVGRLVQQQHVRAGDDDHRERQTRLLATGENPGGFVAVIAGEEEGAEHPASLGLGQVRR